MPKTKQNTQVLVRYSKGGQQTKNPSSSKPSKRKSRSRGKKSSNDQQLAMVMCGSQSRMMNLQKVPRSMTGSLSSCQKRYLLALTSPFHPDAYGAIVPDISNRSTVPFTVRWRSLVYPASGSTVTQISAVQYIFSPNPAIYGAILTSQGDLSAAALYPSYTAIEGVSAFKGYTAISGVPGIIYDQATDQVPLIGAAYSQFRVVAGGVRLSTLLPTSSAAFSMSTFQTPGFSSAVPYPVLNGSNTNNPWTGDVDGAQVSNLFLDYNAFGTNNTINIESRKTYTSYEIMMNPLILSFQPNNPIGHAFRGCDDQPTSIGGDGTGAAAALFGDEYFTVPNGSGLATPPYHNELLNNAGWDALIVNTYGQTSSTTLDIEYVLHCEGVPIYNGSNPYTTGTTHTIERGLNPMYSLESLIGAARSAFSYATSVPRVLNGMMDLYNAVGGRNYGSQQLQRLQYAQGEF